MVQDPVCGMLLDTRDSREQFRYRGSIYHFCCGECRQLFEAHPEKYFVVSEGAEDSDTAARTLRLAGEAFQDLSPDAQSLAAQCIACPGASEVLEHLRHQARVAMSTEDWAHSLSMPKEEVIRTLASLEEWSLVERLEVGGLALFRLTTEEDHRHKVQELLDWRKKWALQISTVSGMLKLEPGRR